MMKIWRSRGPVEAGETLYGIMEPKHDGDSERARQFWKQVVGHENFLLKTTGLPSWAFVMSFVDGIEGRRVF
jgi:hypothetical protein